DGLLDGTEVDGSGLLEIWGPTDPNNADTDGDSLLDGDEAGQDEPVTDDTDMDVFQSNPGISDPNNPDTDGDGYLDSEEDGYGTDPTTGVETKPVKDAFYGGGINCSTSGQPAGLASLLVLALVGLRRRAPAAAGALMVIGSSNALAQDGIDAHELHLAPQRGDVHSAFSVRTPTGVKQFDWYAAGVFEYAHTLLKLNQTYTDDTEGKQIALGRVGVFNIGGGFAFHERFYFEAGLPVVPFSVGLNGQNGFNVGDLRLSGAIQILTPKDDHGFGLAVAPWIDLPTGDETAFLGRNGVAGGGEVAGALRWSRLTIGTTLGVNFQPRINVQNLDGADQLRLGISVGVTPLERWGLTGELLASAPLSVNDVGGAGFPAETRLISRHVVVPGWTLLGGGALGITGGIGASDFRLFLGTAFAPNQDSDKVIDTFSIPTTLEVTTASPIGNIQGAKVQLTIGDQEKTLTMPAEGHMEDELQPGTAITGIATWEPCMTGSAKTDIQLGVNYLQIVMNRESRTQRWVALDADGTKLAGASVSYKDSVGNPCLPPTMTLDDGTGAQAVGIGSWTAVVSAAGYQDVELPVQVKDAVSEREVVMEKAE
ncbi:MAG: hypothetical protein HN348_29755, partial [Proteobacteria bacterium]|nr:hypothetical protein [Pseudomonadota bacterium]